jgi:hypothetical protein
MAKEEAIAQGDFERAVALNDAQEELRPRLLALLRNFSDG